MRATSLSDIPIWFLQEVEVLALTAALVAFYLFPIAHFLGRGWVIKHDDIIGYFKSPRTLSAYFKKFPFEPKGQIGEGALSRNERLRLKFEANYDARLGRTLYVAPLLAFLLVTLPLCFLLSCNLLEALNFRTVGGLGNSLAAPALAALAGAGLWVAYDLTLRSWQRSLLPLDLYQYALRFLFAVPVGYVFNFTFNNFTGVLVPFVVGAFPIREFVALLHRAGYKIFEFFGVQTDPAVAADSISKLQGIDYEIAERLYREDIYTISQLATADPVRIAMRTNLDFNFVIDCVSQALAWVYLGDDLSKIRSLGLRGAFEIKTYVDAYDYEEKKDKRRKWDNEKAEANLPAIATILGADSKLVEFQLYEIAEDPYTEFLHSIWH